MSDKVVDFPGREGKSKTEVLTELLGKVQRGEITQIAVAILYIDGDVGFVVPQGEEFYKLIGAIESMKVDMLRMKQGG